ncbi:MAG: Maf family protein [Firmicutes bacterium]|jgi:septum formation protein|nr:Maf family protein [Bacillota bacterium]
MGTPTLVLASTSPRRIELLRQIGLQFVVVPSGADETLVGGGPAEIAEALALSKAESVAGRVGSGLVIGADTVVALDGEILGKPRDPADARMMLEKLSGRAHSVVTGVAVVDAATGRRAVEYEESRVWFRALNSDEIEAYVSSGEPMDKAGAYGVQGLGSVLVERIEGCYFNVVGLPLPRLARILKSFGLDVLRAGEAR